MAQTVLITGSSSGIGKTTAVYFAQQGWNVAVTMRSPKKEKELLSFPKIKLYALDVNKSASVTTAIQAAIDDFGRIDVVVNNAGYGVDGAFESIDEQTIEDQFQTNVFGLMRVTKAVLPHMRKNGGGTIIQISSDGWKTGVSFV